MHIKRPNTLYEHCQPHRNVGRCNNITNKALTTYPLATFAVLRIMACFSLHLSSLKKQAEYAPLHRWAIHSRCSWCVLYFCECLGEGYPY